MGPWGFHFDRTNTWFDDAGPWLTYAARCQHLLRQGSFAADILYFAGENSPVQVPVHIEEPIAATLSGARPKLPQPVPAGHDYDVADADVLMNRVRIEDRSEEHTSELQSLMRISYAVFSLKKKNKHMK